MRRTTMLLAMVGPMHSAGDTVREFLAAHPDAFKIAEPDPPPQMEAPPGYFPRNRHERRAQAARHRSRP